MKSIAWMTFVLVLGLALSNSQKTSFDLAARNLAAANDTKLASLERSAIAVEAGEVQSLSRMGAGLDRALQATAIQQGLR